VVRVLAFLLSVDGNEVERRCWCVRARWLVGPGILAYPGLSPWAEQALEHDF
jgi:hypothetical protein